MANTEQVDPVCHWSEDDPDCGVWVGDCGINFQFMSDGPWENDFRFCPRCGRKIEIKET